MLIRKGHVPTNLRRWLVLPLCCLCGFVPFGCQKQEQITTYSVEKQQNEATGHDATPADARLLGAIIPQGKWTWFFKAAGPADLLEKEADTFRAFIESVHFSTGEKPEPEWKLPAGWNRSPGSGMRFATLRFGPQQSPFELSVIPLLTADGASDEYILENVNLWRRQLSLGPIRQEQMAEETTHLELGGAKVTLVNLVGHQSINRGATRGHGGTSMPRRPPAASAATQRSDLTFDQPEGWTRGRVGGMRKAAFVVTDGDQKAEITVIDLPPSDLLANVNRWRGQIQLPPMQQAQLDAAIKNVQVGKTNGKYIELIGPEDAKPREAIFAVIAQSPNKTWFIKLKGNLELANREKERFHAFFQSLQLSPAAGDGDGK